MRHPVAAVVVAVCRRCAKEAGLDPAALTRVLKARVVLAVRVVTVVRVVPVVRATSADLVARVTADPAAQVVPVVRAVPVTSADPAVRATTAQVVPATSAVPAAPATSEDLAVLATSADPVVPTTSDRDLPTPSADSVVPRGVTEQRRGAGEYRRESGGVGRSLHRAEYGTKGRSTIGATTSNRYGIRAKTVGASISSESGSRCNQPAG